VSRQGVAVSLQLAVQLLVPLLLPDKAGRGQRFWFQGQELWRDHLRLGNAPASHCLTPSPFHPSHPLTLSPSHPLPCHPLTVSPSHHVTVSLCADVGYVILAGLKIRLRPSPSSLPRDDQLGADYEYPDYCKSGRNYDVDQATAESTGGLHVVSGLFPAADIIDLGPGTQVSDSALLSAPCQFSLPLLPGSSP